MPQLFQGLTLLDTLAYQANGFKEIDLREKVPGKTLQRLVFAMKLGHTIVTDTVATLQNRQPWTTLPEINIHSNKNGDVVMSEAADWGLARNVIAGRQGYVVPDTVDVNATDVYAYFSIPFGVPGSLNPNRTALYMQRPGETLMLRARWAATIAEAIGTFTASSYTTAPELLVYAQMGSPDDPIPEWVFKRSYIHRSDIGAAANAVGYKIDIPTFPAESQAGYTALTLMTMDDAGDASGLALENTVGDSEISIQEKNSRGTATVVPGLAGSFIQREHGKLFNVGDPTSGAPSASGLVTGIYPVVDNVRRYGGALSTSLAVAGLKELEMNVKHGAPTTSGKFRLLTDWVERRL